MCDWNETRNDLIEFLGTICRAGQTLDTVDDAQNLVDAGFMDSLAVVQIIVHLEQRHQVSLRDSGIDPAELMTISGILKTIGNARQ